MTQMAFMQRFRSGSTITSGGGGSGNVIGTPTSTFDKIFGPYPATEASITGGPGYIANWYSEWTAYEDAQYTEWAVNNVNNASWYYDPTQAYLGRYMVTGTSSFLTKAKAYSDAMITNLTYGSGTQLYNEYSWGTYARYASDSTPSGFTTTMKSRIEGGQGLGVVFFWGQYCSNAANLDPANTYQTDGRSVARLLQQALGCHALGVGFTAANLYNGGIGPSPKPGACANYAAVAESCVDAILANQDAGGGWQFQYSGDSHRYYKGFMNLLICHSLYDYLRIIQPTAGGARYNAVIAAIQGCADALYTNGWISGSYSTPSQECWYYCFPSPGYVGIGDVPLPGDDLRDLGFEIAWLYALMKYLGKTRSGSTAGTNDYGDIAQRAITASTNILHAYQDPGQTSPASQKNYGKQCHELGYRWHQTIYFLLNA